MLNFENQNKMIFKGVGKYSIPEINPITDIMLNKLEWIPFNYALTAKNREKKGVHFYIDDYQFLRVWNNPDKYISLLQEFGAVCSPDFSLYTDMPKALQIYNHYRKQWLSAYWQMNGIKVIPTLCWSTPDSYEWCFDGVPTDGIVSVSSVGTQNNKQVTKNFVDGCKYAIEKTDPVQILWYGICPIELDWNVHIIKPHYEKIVERRLKNGR